MGALVPVYPWIAEDDLLLKNAVEAGASLESLAKGAVQFSQRFTVQELQNRWYSLLYDPFVSIKASARMTEYERSTSTLPSKSNKLDSVKESKCISGKKRAESVRRCYYAMRKRICHEPFDPMDINFLVGPCNNYIGNGDKPPSGECMLDDPIPNHFELQEPICVISNDPVSDFRTVAAAATNAGVPLNVCCTVPQNSVEDLSVDQSNGQREMPHSFEESLSLNGNCSTVVELGQAKEFSPCNLYEVDDLETNNPAIFDHIDIIEANMCSGFGGGQILNSSVSDCGASFNIEYSSPLPQLPIWNMDCASAPTFTDIDLEGEEHHMGDTFALSDGADVNETDTTGYNISLSDSMLKDENLRDNMNNSADDYLAELSHSLFDFTKEDELLDMDANVKDTMNEISLLLDSPNRDDICAVTISEAPVATDEYLNVPENAWPVGISDNEQHHCGGHTVCNSETQILLSVSAAKSEFPEMCSGIICCTFNTEDTEIPSNDDVFLLNRMSSPTSAAQWKFHETIYPTFLSATDHSGSQKTTEGVQNVIKREHSKSEQSHKSSQIIGSQLLAERGANISTADCGVKFGVPKNDAQHGSFRNVDSVCEGANRTSSENLNAKKHPATMKEEVTDTEEVKHFGNNLADTCRERKAHGFDSLVCYHQNNSCCIKQEVDTPINIHRHEEIHTELGSTEISVPDVKPFPSNLEELPSESDDDVPCFSDVEAMIIDMDLSPDDNNLNSYKKVSRYMHEDTKRAIIRLEQAASAYMHRAIASRGAYAILYGRYSKHYIRKPEVVLGRATEDIKVDIDLAREGRANKISRRQAIIKMDKGGSFHLKNLGRYSIFVNDKEIVPKQSSTIASGCLIEVRGMPLIFETNETCIKQYVNDIIEGSQIQEQNV